MGSRSFLPRGTKLLESARKAIVSEERTRNYPFRRKEPARRGSDRLESGRRRISCPLAASHRSVRPLMHRSEWTLTPAGRAIPVVSQSILVASGRERQAVPRRVARILAALARGETVDIPTLRERAGPLRMPAPVPRQQAGSNPIGACSNRKARPPKGNRTGRRPQH